MLMPSRPTPPPDARSLVDDVVREALRRRASDVHLEPTADGYEVRYRVDGILSVANRHEAAVGRSMVARLMVLAHLLTYRLDVPQEGRLTIPRDPSVAGSPPPGPAGTDSPPAAAPLDLRLAVMPTTHGLRAVLRLPAELTQPHRLDALGLPAPVLAGLHKFAAADAGMLLVTGPAGSGKTTTIYALLRHIVDHSPGLSVVALEDPVERDVPGVTQIQVQPFGELTYERTLRSILRQDPQVLMLGEIRDAATASLAVQAALSGHRLVCTLHAATCGGAVARLLEMGIEPYQITSALFASSPSASCVARTRSRSARRRAASWTRASPAAGCPSPSSATPTRPSARRSSSARTHRRCRTCSGSSPDIEGCGTLPLTSWSGACSTRRRCGGYWAPPEEARFARHRCRYQVRCPLPHAGAERASVTSPRRPGFVLSRDRAARSGATLRSSPRVDLPRRAGRAGANGPVRSSALES
jgi:Tfp pilus assembly pilus retraction ATPase PilT